MQIQTRSTPLYIAILKLTRWREFLPFTSVLSLIGGLVAYQEHRVQLDWRLAVVFMANMCAMAYAFMINDIEDATDDAHDPERGSRNPITAGELSKSVGWTAAVISASLALIGYAIVGSTWTFAVGVLTVLLAHLYSWHYVRLKALPLVDIISHALMLSTLLYLAPFYIYSHDLGDSWVLAIGTFLISAYGQLYNQTRDYEADQAAGLHNTASILGKRITDMLAKGSIVGFILSLVITAIQGIFPLWLAIPFVIAIPIGYVLGKQDTDMRGQATTDPMALIQLQVLLTFNLTLLMWLAIILFFN